MLTRCARLLVDELGAAFARKSHWTNAVWGDSQVGDQDWARAMGLFSRSALSDSAHL
ncbi:MAG: hypothetical protein M3Z85_17555 [Acidobacteriota bacterium]|nr:hypothetical protein [Acidobacteriota bacterium]